MRKRFIVLLSAVVAACGSPMSAPRRVEGPSSALAGGTITSWVQFDARGALTEVGFVLPMASIMGASEQTSVFLEVPAEAQAAGFVQHIGIDYNPNGHPPEAYSAPHFDVHYYGISAMARMAIDCRDEPMPASDRVPEPYVIPGTGPEPMGTCVPQMGVHAINPTSPELSMTDPQPFTQTFILGYHRGALSFIEPMVTRTHLASRADFMVTVPRPASLGRSTPTLFPATFAATYDASADAYRFVLANFSPAQ